MKRGRDKRLIEKRNEALLRRYYELTEKKRLRFDDTLRILSEQEFFISEETIMRIIREEGGKLNAIRVRPFPRIKLPHLNLNQL